MKKFFSLTGILGLMMTFFAFSAAGKTVKVVVDDPTHVTVMQVNEYGATPLEFDANNSAELIIDSSAPVTASTGYEIVSITTSAGVSATTTTLPASSANIDGTNLQDGDTVNIVTAQKQVRTFTIETATPEHITSVTYMYQWITPSAPGLWKIPITDEYSTVQINVDPNCKIVSLKDINGNAVPFTNNSPSISPVDYPGDATFYIVTASRDEDRTASVTVNFTGDPSSVVFTRYNGSVINLVEGTQAVYYDPETEVPFSLSHNIYRRSIFKVEVDGEKVAKNDEGSYRFTPTDGGVVDIVVDYPDVDVPVKISLADANLEGVIKEVTVNGQLVNKDEWNSDSFTVKAGSTLGMEIDYVRFSDINFTVNGEAATMPLFIEAEDQYNIVVNATRIPDNNITIYCANWQYLSVISGNETYELTGEATKISVPGNNGYVQFRGRDNYLVTGVFDYFTNKPYTVTNGYLYNLENNMSLVVELDLYERNETAIFYLEDTNWDYALLSYGYQEVAMEVHLQPGYNTIKFNRKDLPFRFSGYSYVDGTYLTPEVYVNDLHSENLFGAYSGLESIQNNDVVSIFNHEVELCPVDVTVADGVSANIVKNLVQEMGTQSFSALPGALVQITGTQLIVKVDGSQITADENGVFNVTVNGATTIDITKDGSTGVEAVEAEGVADVYTLQGVLVKRNATADDVNTLPAGLYIVGGKKVIVR